MYLENAMLSDINEMHKKHVVCFHLYETCRMDKFIETKSKLDATRGLEKGDNGEFCLKVYWVSIWGHKKF